VTKWDARHIKSPFRINLLAEEERIHEEYFIKQKEDDIRKRQIEQMKEKAKADIVIKVTSPNNSNYVC
jgi:hypothetical protein